MVLGRRSKANEGWLGTPHEGGGDGARGTFDLSMARAPHRRHFDCAGTFTTSTSYLQQVKRQKDQEGSI